MRCRLLVAHKNLVVCDLLGAVCQGTQPTDRLKVHCFGRYRLVAEIFHVASTMS